MDKSPDAFRTISEVADDLDVPQHVLRFWESKFHQIKPLKRGGGRRYYRPDDVDLLRGIKQLLYGDGYTIKGVQKILREQGVAYAQTIWGDQHSATQMQGAEPEHIPSPGSPTQSEPRPADNEPDTPAASISRSSKVKPVEFDAERLRILKAALFELSEIKLLLESAPGKP